MREERGSSSIFATLALLAAQNPEAVSDTLSRSSVTILDTYSHVLPNMQDELAIAWENILKRGYATYPKAFVRLRLFCPRKSPPDSSLRACFIPNNVLPKIRVELTQGHPYRFLSLLPCVPGCPSRPVNTVIYA